MFTYRARIPPTIEAALSKRLKEIASRQRISESLVIEYALLLFFQTGSDEQLAGLVRRNDAARRRRMTTAMLRRPH